MGTSGHAGVAFPGTLRKTRAHVSEERCWNGYCLPLPLESKCPSSAAAGAAPGPPPGASAARSAGPPPGASAAPSAGPLPGAWAARSARPLPRARAVAAPARPPGPRNLTFFFDRGHGGWGTPSQLHGIPAQPHGKPAQPRVRPAHEKGLSHL